MSLARSKPAVSPLVIVFVTVFIDLLGFGIIIPLLPFYAETFGATALTVGLLSASFSLMQFLFAPIWGRLSDRIGRRPIILLGLFGSFLSYLIFGLAQSLSVLFIARISAGIAGANIPTAQAFIADTTTPENRAKGMGLVGAAFGLGFIFGPAVGGFLSQWGYAAPAFFASALSCQLLRGTFPVTRIANG
jgi:DHA1 family tetracycline resistance protein-like MFS transporter